MTPIKYAKTFENDLDFDTMTLINIVGEKGKLFYFFLVDYKDNDKNCKDLISLSEIDYLELVYNNYEIV